MVRTPPPTVNERVVAAAVIDGSKVPVKSSSPITASTPAVGTPLVQFPAVAQAVLVVPRQLVVCAELAMARNDNRMVTTNLGAGNDRTNIDRLIVVENANNQKYAPRPIRNRLKQGISTIGVTCVSEN